MNYLSKSFQWRRMRPSHWGKYWLRLFFFAETLLNVQLSVRRISSIRRFLGIAAGTQRWWADSTKHVARQPVIGQPLPKWKHKLATQPLIQFVETTNQRWNPIKNGSTPRNTKAFLAETSCCWIQYNHNSKEKQIRWTQSNQVKSQ